MSNNLVLMSTPTIINFAYKGLKSILYMSFNLGETVHAMLKYFDWKVAYTQLLHGHFVYDAYQIWYPSILMIRLMDTEFGTYHVQNGRVAITYTQSFVWNF